MGIKPASPSSPVITLGRYLLNCSLIVFVLFDFTKIDVAQKISKTQWTRMWDYFSRCSRKRTGDNFIEDPVNVYYICMLDTKQNWIKCKKNLNHWLSNNENACFF